MSKEQTVHILFVHGMGRSPLSGWWLLDHLKRLGYKASSFGYVVMFEDFASIKNRLASKILEMAEQEEEYILIGHSLGGVLLRAAINSLPSGTKLPRHLFLLGAPFQPARLAQRLSHNPIYRFLTRDCGQLLGSISRMSEIGLVSVPTTSIAGIRGLPWKSCPFDGELNDGVVSISEVSIKAIADQVEVLSIHTFLPSNQQVAEIILNRLVPS
jgi:pimeloyl-ACP methyl ester carboxylesterase